ncbi:hypothetical protein [Formosa haliotis]|uniref:hypothetical protein n=1 Tax=Formosa haliotis TaxID=1555194 RepID=UPI0011478C90|nr:hypothetical protein [Formosa haliotis]
MCVQKSDQQGCNGKCHLINELRKHELNDSTKTPISAEKRLALDIYQLPTINHIPPVWNQTLENKKIIITYTFNVSSLVLDIDTPPPNFI